MRGEFQRGVMAEEITTCPGEATRYRLKNVCGPKMVRVFLAHLLVSCWFVHHDKEVGT